MSQVKEHNKASEKELNEMEISNLPDVELKILSKRMFNELSRRVDELSENFSKEIENIQKETKDIKGNQSEVKNIITNEYIRRNQQ